MAFYIGSFVALVLAGGWNLMIAILGLFPKFQSTTMGTLAKGSIREIARDKYGRTWRMPDGNLLYNTRYTYVYTVRGKQYRYSGSGSQGKSRLLPKMELVYVKGFPRRAYPYKFRGTKEWAMGVLLFFGGLFLLFATAQMTG